MPALPRRPTGPLTVKPEHAKLAAYFNLDNGTGRIRGVYAQENAAVVPIFETWIEPLKDLGVTTVTLRNTSGTDHLSFDAVGLPGFQFIQDEVEYETRTHHTNMDVYERLPEGRPDAGLGRHRLLRLRGGHARRNAAAQAHADRARPEPVAAAGETSPILGW